MGLTVVEDIADFLAKAPPFQFLEPESLLGLAGSVLVEFFPKGSVILTQGGPPSRFLYIVARGGVKVFMTAGDGEEIIIDLRSEGDIFGFVSLYSGDRSRTTVTALEDTTAYLLAREPFMALFDANPLLRDYFHRTFIAKYMDKAFTDMRNRSLLHGGGEKLLFTTTVGQIAVRGVVTAPRDVSIQTAAELMSRNRVSSLVLTEPDGSPSGIVTDRDLRDKVAAKGRDVGEPVANVMSGTLLRTEARNYCFEALLTMIRHGVHHLLVVDEGRLRGVITNHDLMMLQGTSPLAVARDIENQQEIGGLVAAAGKINQLVGLLLKEGAKAGNVTRIISEINDRLVRRVLELLERDLGPAPLPWSWIVFGSEGRKEQTFKTDQDNALIFGEPGSEAEAVRAQEWFAVFARQATDALIRCGFPVCPAGYMASNPLWRQPLAAWKRRFTEWVTNPTAEAVLRSFIFFDFRHLAGAAEPVERLRDHLVATVDREPAFLGFMANQLVKNRPPIGFFQRFVVEKGGEHKAELNLKLKGIAPIVDLARFFAMEKGVRETGTLERIHALRERHTIVAEYADEIEHAFEFIMLLRIHHQYGQIARGAEPDNFVNPNTLSNLERRTVKEAFLLIARIQDLVIERYRASIW
jgi:CBS domain-containing protein